MSTLLCLGEMEFKCKSVTRDLYFTCGGWTDAFSLLFRGCLSKKKGIKRCRKRGSFMNTLR